HEPERVCVRIPCTTCGTIEAREMLCRSIVDNLPQSLAESVSELRRAQARLDITCVSRPTASQLAMFIGKALPDSRSPNLFAGGNVWLSNAQVGPPLPTNGKTDSLLLTTHAGDDL